MPTALSDIEGLLAHLDAHAATRATLRQRRWALEQAVDAAAAARSLPDLPLADAWGQWNGRGREKVTTAELLSPMFVEAFLDLARTGALATRSRRRLPETTPWNDRARVASLRALAAFTEAGPIPAYNPGDVLRRRPRLGPGELGSILTTLAGPARGSSPTAAQVRLGALLACMWIEPRRADDLLSLCLDDLLYEGERPYALVSLSGTPRGLSAVVSSTLMEWLVVRRTLVEGLQGSDHGRLWVSVRQVPRTATVSWAAGMPLHSRGLQRSYAAAVQAANDRHAGELGFPLPGSLDLLRRSLIDRVAPPTGLERLEF